jgi:hypothetical protein
VGNNSKRRYRISSTIHASSLCIHQRTAKLHQICDYDIFILSFFLKPLQNAIMTLWARVIESDKHVFTLVFGGTAALANAIQEIIKIFW